MKKHWEEKLHDILESNDGHFGHNVKVDIRRYLRRIEKLCADNGRVDGTIFCEIDVLDEYTVKITLPEVESCDAPFRENVLMHILTTSPLPTECRYNKKKDQLTLEWHY
jgi:hypothetical protein